MFYRDPADLSPRAVEVLKWLAEHKDGGSADEMEDGYLAACGLDVWYGLNRTTRRVVNQLLECVFISDESGVNESSKLYAINECGVRWLKGELPYCNHEGKWFATMFELEAASSKKNKRRYRVCAYCGKREYDLSKMEGTPTSTYRSESHFVHKACVPTTASEGAKK
jgi:hypothetical protein